MIPEEAVAHVAASLEISTNRARRLAHTALPAGFVRQVTDVPRVVLVEGATDVAVFSALLGVPVVAVGGKHVFRLAVAVARAHACSVAVVLDGDRGADHGGFRAHRGSERVRTELPDVEVHVLDVDLEHVLADWPSFLDALRRTGSDLDVKDPAAYATAARTASAIDIPAPLTALVSTLS